MLGSTKHQAPRTLSLALGVDVEGDHEPIRSFVLEGLVTDSIGFDLVLIRPITGVIPTDDEQRAIQRSAGGSVRW